MRATTAVPAELARADLQRLGSRHGERLTVPRGLGLLTTRLCREMKRKAEPRSS